MKNLFYLAVVAIVAYFGWQHYVSGGGARIVEREGTKIAVAHTLGGTAEYTLGESGEETYMVFGATSEHSAESHAALSGIPLKTAARLKARYPDFTRCDSAGAKEAQSRVEDIRLLAGKREHHAAMKTMAGEYESRMRARGERLCVTVRGQRLELAAIAQLGGRLTYEELKARLPEQALKGSYVLTESITLGNCSDLI